MGLSAGTGVLDLSWSLDHCGPMTWTVEDSALMLQAIAGYDPKDPASARVAVPDYSEALREDVKGLVIGVPEHYCFGKESGTDEEVTALVKKALEDLESLGAHIEPVTIPCLEYSPVVNIVIIMSEAYSIHLPNVRTQPQNFGENFIKHLYMGGLFSASDYVQAQRVRSQIRREFHEVMKRCDLLAMPMGHRVPGKLEDFEPGYFPVWPQLHGALQPDGAACDFRAVRVEQGRIARGHAASWTSLRRRHGVPGSVHLPAARGAL